MVSTKVEGLLGAAGFPWQVSHSLQIVPFLLILATPPSLSQMTPNVMAYFSSSSCLWIFDATTPAMSPPPPTDTFKAYRAENQGIILNNRELLFCSWDEYRWDSHVTPNL